LTMVEKLLTWIYIFCHKSLYNFCNNVEPGCSKMDVWVADTIG